MWDFSTSILSLNIKNQKGPSGEPILFQNKVPQCQKTERRFSHARYCMLRVKKEKTFLILFARPNSSNDKINLRRTFVELFWSVRVV